MTLLKRLGKTLLLTLLLVAIFLIFILGTNPGLHLTLGLVNDFIPGTIETRSLTGSLAFGFTAKDLSYHDAQYDAALQHFRLKLNVLPLLLGKINIHDLTAQGLKMTLKSEQPTAQKTPITETTTDSTSLLALWQQHQVIIHHLDIEAVNIKQVDAPFPIQIKQITLSTQFQNTQWQVQGHWKSLLLPINNKKQKAIYVPNGQLHMEGNEQRYTYNLYTEILGHNFPGSNWVIKGHGDRHTIYLDEMQSELLGGEIVGNGEIGFQPAIHWTFNIKSENIDPGQVIKQAKGQFGLDFSTTGNLVQNHPEFSLNLRKLKGQFGQRHFDAHGSIRYQQHQLEVHHFALHSNKTALQVNGHISQHSNLTWTAHIADLSDLVPSANGKLDGQGRVLGALPHPHLIARVNAKNLNYHDNTTDSLHATLNMNLAHSGRDNAQLTLQNSRLFRHFIKTIKLGLNGRTEQHVLRINVVDPAHVINVLLNGKWQPGSWHAVIRKLNVNSQYSGSWHLSHNTKLHLSQQQQSLSPLCMQQNNANVCMQLNRDGQSLKELSVIVNHWNLAWFNHLLNDKGQLQGQANLKLNYNTKVKKQLAEFQFSIPNSTLRYQIDDKPHTVSMSGNAKGWLGQNGLNIKSQFNLNKQHAFNATLHLPELTTLRQPTANDPIHANIQLNNQQLNWLSALFPDVDIENGTLGLSGQLTGTLAQPKLSGTAGLNNLLVKIPKLNLTLKNFAARFEAATGNKITFNAQTQSGDGILRLKGTTLLTRYLPTRFTLKGNNVLISNSDDYYGLADIDLYGLVGTRALHTEGNVTLTKARITPHNVDNSVVSLPSDVVFSKQKPKIPFEVYSDISVKLDKQHILLDTSGVKGHIVGQLALKQRPGQPAMGDGTLQVKHGTYTTHKQVIRLSKANIIFKHSPLSNPNLNIEATRQIGANNLVNDNNTPQRLEDLDDVGNTSIDVSSSDQTLVVGIRIRGTVDHPIYSLFSIPANQTQSNILAYLILGHATSGTTAAGAQTLLTAASAMNLGGASISNIKDQIQNTLGLDQISIESTPMSSEPTLTPNIANEAQSNTSIVLGKRLGKNLFVNVSVGLLQPINVIRLKYLLAKNWTLETQASTQNNGNQGNGIDLFYHIERGTFQKYRQKHTKARS